MACSRYIGKKLSNNGFTGLYELAANDGYAKVTYTGYLLSFITHFNSRICQIESPKLGI
jgi:hypothetical protein